MNTGSKGIYSRSLSLSLYIYIYIDIYLYMCVYISFTRLCIVSSVSCATCCPCAAHSRRLKLIMLKRAPCAITKLKISMHGLFGFNLQLSVAKAQTQEDSNKVCGYLFTWLVVCQLSKELTLKTSHCIFYATFFTKKLRIHSVFSISYNIITDVVVLNQTIFKYQPEALFEKNNITKRFSESAVVFSLFHRFSFFVFHFLSTFHAHLTQVTRSF